MGFGGETSRVFDADACVHELADFIRAFDKKVLLIGFSLGAQLAFKLIFEYTDLFYAAIIVSPWLDKKESTLPEVMRINERQLSSFKKKWLCNIIGMMNGLPRAQRKEFVEQMQKVKIETIRKAVDNGITFDNAPGFANIDFPIIALAGGKEQQDVQDSVKRMAERNTNCRYEIWEKAAHNIPPLFSKQFNKLILEIVQ